MTQREQRLALAVGVLLAGTAVWGGIKWGIIDRWNNLDQAILDTRKKAGDLKLRLAQATAARAEWSRLQPISYNPHRAEERFLADMTALVTEHGLTEDMKIRPRTPRTIRLSPELEFTEVGISVQARGSLQQLTEFLTDYYCRGYLTKLETIRVTAEEPAAARPVRRVGTVRRPGRGGSTMALTPAAPRVSPDGPKLTIDLIALALVPQKPKGADLPIASDEELAASQPSYCERLPRLVEEYAAVWKRNIFKEWQEPVIAVEPTPTQPIRPPVEAKRDEIKIVPPTPPPNKKVVSTVAFNGRLEAGIRDMDNLANQLERVSINDPVHDGTLVLVEPQGIVVQVTDENASGGSHYKYYFYRLGATFGEREELDARSFPELHEKLQRSLTRGPES